MLSLRGKLINYMFLVPGGKFRLGHVIKAVDSKMPKGDHVTLTPNCKEQLFWWFLMLQGYTDAAGCTPNKVGHGVGGILEPDIWFFIPWPSGLNRGKANSDNIKFDRKMSVLELLTPGTSCCCTRQSSQQTSRDPCGQPGCSQYLCQRLFHQLSLLLHNCSGDS